MMVLSHKARRLLAIGLALVLLVVVSAWMTVRFVVVSSAVDWNTWVNDIHIACQAGSDEDSVRLFLGEPDDVRSPAEPVLGLVPQAPDMVPNAERILLYSRGFVHRGYWAAHIYIDKGGRVIAYHIGAS